MRRSRNANLTVRPRGGPRSMSKLHQSEDTRSFEKTNRDLFTPGRNCSCPQGRRTKSAHQKGHHVLVIPGGLLATDPHTDPGCSAATYEIDCDLAQDSQIASCGSIPDAAVILPAGATHGTPIRERCLPKTPSTEFRYSSKPGPVSLVQAAAHSCGDRVQC